MSDKKIFRYSCDCGCGDGVEFINDFGRLYVHPYRGDWYSEQGRVRSGLRERLGYMSGNRILREVLMTEDAVRDLLAFLDGVELEEDWRPSGPAYAGLAFEADEEFDLRYLYLEGRMPSGGILFGWYHRMFELDAGPDDVAAWKKALAGMLPD